MPPPVRRLQRQQQDPSALQQAAVAGPAAAAPAQRAGRRFKRVSSKKRGAKKARQQPASSAWRESSMHAARFISGFIGVLAMLGIVDAYNPPPWLGILLSIGAGPACWLLAHVACCLVSLHLEACVQAAACFIAATLSYSTLVVRARTCKAASLLAPALVNPAVFVLVLVLLWYVGPICRLMSAGCQRLLAAVQQMIDAPGHLLGMLRRHEQPAAAATPQDSVVIQLGAPSGAASVTSQQQQSGEAPHQQEDEQRQPSPPPADVQQPTEQPQEAAATEAAEQAAAAEVTQQAAAAEATQQAAANQQAGPEAQLRATKWMLTSTFLWISVLNSASVMVAGTASPLKCGLPWPHSLALSAVAFTAFVATAHPWGFRQWQGVCKDWPATGSPTEVHCTVWLQALQVAAAWVFCTLAPPPLTAKLGGVYVVAQGLLYRSAPRSGASAPLHSLLAFGALIVVGMALPRRAFDQYAAIINSLLAAHPFAPGYTAVTIVLSFSAYVNNATRSGVAQARPRPRASGGARQAEA